jgi:hypothetical protein
VVLSASKRNRGPSDNNNNNGDNDMNTWYDSVEDDATPDKVFWQEMERQRLYNQLGGEGAGNTNLINGGMIDPVASIGSMGGGGGGGGGVSSSTPMSSSSSSSIGSIGGGGGIAGGTSSWPIRKPPTMDEQKAAESTLSEYSAFMVSDNWLDEELQAQMLMNFNQEEEEELTIAQETQRLEEQLEALPDGYGSTRQLDDDDEEIWDVWKKDQETDPSTRDSDRRGIRQVQEPEPGMLCVF